MKTFLRNLITLNRRDLIGLACWLFVSILLGSLALPVMIGREIYQYRHYHLAKFEWEDIVRYTIVIILGSIINSIVFAYILKMNHIIMLC